MELNNERRAYMDALSRALETERALIGNTIIYQRIIQKFMEAYTNADLDQAKKFASDEIKKLAALPLKFSDQ